MEKEISLPLFAHLQVPIDVYVIKNNLIGMCWSNTSYYTQPVKIFELLKELNKNSSVKQIIPKSISQYLEGEMKPIKKGFEWTYPRVFGVEEEKFCNYCFDFDISIEESNNTVQLFNFIYEYQDKVILFDYKLTLSVMDAFFLLANTCIITGSIYPIEKRLKESKQLNINRNEMKQAIEQVIKQNKQFEPYLSNYNFVAEYLFYVKKMLENKALTPNEILRLNGAKTLALLIESKPVSSFLKEIMKELKENVQQFTTNQKIMYYTFFEITKYITQFCKFNLYQELEKFTVKHQTIFNKLEKELFIGMPLESGHKKEYSYKKNWESKFNNSNI